MGELQIKFLGHGPAEKRQDHIARIIIHKGGLQIDDAFVSHMHARILRRGQFYFVEDLGSTNGTFVNGQRVSGDAQLRVRDELRFGETVLRYEE